MTSTYIYPPSHNKGAIVTEFHKSLTPTERELLDRLLAGPVTTPDVAADAACFRVHLSNIRKKIRQHNARIEIVTAYQKTQYKLQASFFDDKVRRIEMGLI
jgi:hypothetical protein